jgi:hypothetical protein
MTLHTLADLTFVLGYKVELKAMPLCAAACWADFDEQAVEAYAGGWGLVHSDKYKSVPEQRSAHVADPTDECLMVA